MAVFDIPTGLAVTSNSSSYQGLPGSYRDKLLETLIPQLGDSAMNMPKNIDDATEGAYGSYRTQLKNVLDNYVPTVVNNLANRGVLDSTVASNAIQETQSKAIHDFANQGYDAAVQNALLKTQIPEMLTKMAQLGTFSKSTSNSNDPVAIYNTMSGLLKEMM